MPRPQAPIWLMGLTNATFGMYGGIVAVSIPQLLSAQHLPEKTIASVSAIMLSPGFCTFLFSPILDVRFSRRWYSLSTALVAAVMLALSIANLNHLLVLQIAMLLGFFAANLNQSAVGGWLSSITTPEQQKLLSVWINIGNIAGGGVMAVFTGELVRHLPLPFAAILLGLAVLLPTAIFPFMQAPGPDRRLASESFPQFFAEILALLRRREVLVAILLFLAPAGTFALTNFLAGLGTDFHASSHFVGVIGGGGACLGGILGCLLFPAIRHLLPLRLLYLAIGIVGACFTLSLIVLPRTPASFAVAFIGQIVFQSLIFTVSTAIAFELIGPDNPLASTTFCLTIAAFNIPITYMLLVDGAAYTRLGLSGSLATDAAFSIVSSLLLGALILHLTRTARSKTASPGL